MAYYKCGSIYVTNNSDVRIGSASGGVANFNTSLALPLANLKAYFNATQASGTPTPATPLPISGWSEITLDVNGTTEVINLGGTYYGGHFTQDKDGHRQFEVTHSELLDMGDLTWANFDPSANIFRASVTNCKEPVDNSDRKNGFLCSIYPPSTTVSINANMTDKSMLRFSGYLVLRDTSFSNYSEIASAVSGQKLIYELATPYVIDLPDGEPIITLNGTNNIYADTGDCAVEYKVSVEQYVSNHSGGSGAKSLGGVFLGGSNSGSEEEPTEESEDTEKTKEIDEPKEEIKTIGDEPISKK